MLSEKKQLIDETLQQKIQQRAYEIWESEGCPDTCDIDHWLRAEAEILSSSGDGENQSKPAKRKAKK